MGLYSKTPCISRDVGYHRKKPYKKRDVIKKLSFLKSINHEVINKVAQPILKFLQKDEEFYVREHVATAIGTIGDSKLARPILEALKNDEDAYVKLSVAKAFLKIGDRGEALNIFQGLKKNDNAYIRTKIANAFLEFNLFDSVNK